MTLAYWYKSKPFLEDIPFSRQQDRLHSERACYNLIEKSDTRITLFFMRNDCHVAVCVIHSFWMLFFHMNNYYLEHLAPEHLTYRNFLDHGDRPF